MKSQNRFGSYGLRALVAGVLILISQPLLYLVIRASEKSGSDIVALLTRQKTFEVLGLTLALLCIVVFINVFLGTAIAAGLHYVRIPYPRALFVATIVPLAIPSYVFTYTWIALIPSLQGLWAAAFILVLSTMPYMLLAVSISFARIDSGLIEVARSLGLSKFAVFTRVILPQVRRSISAGALLSGLYVLSDFGAVSLLNVETLTVSIQNLFKSSYDRSAAAVIGLLLFLAAALFVSLESLVKGRDFESRGAEGFAQRIRQLAAFHSYNHSSGALQSSRGCTSVLCIDFALSAKSQRSCRIRSGNCSAINNLSCSNGSLHRLPTFATSGFLDYTRS
jgi:iron(III) transport system permease protein